MKSEPDECSIDDVLRAPGRKTPWSGVRNYQARNFMRDQMRPGDGVLFYHSSCAEPGIAGIAEVASEAYPDATQFERSSPYFDPKSTRTAPRWVNVDVRGLHSDPWDHLTSREKELLIFCQVGLRGYLACRILNQRGFRSRNLTGGYKTYCETAGITGDKPVLAAEIKSDTGETDPQKLQTKS